MNTTTQDTTTFEGRLKARREQMDRNNESRRSAPSPEQKIRNAAKAKERYNNRTEEDKEADRLRDRKRYAHKTVDDKEDAKERKRQRYIDAHPNSRPDKEQRRVAANKRIDAMVRDANVQG